MLHAWKAPLARATKDLDFLGRLDNSLESVAKVIREVCAADVGAGASFNLHWSAGGGWEDGFQAARPVGEQLGDGSQGVGGDGPGVGWGRQGRSRYRDSGWGEAQLWRDPISAQDAVGLLGGFSAGGKGYSRRLDPIHANQTD